MAYDAFISYSHSADGQLAPAVQSGLQRLARPWYRRRALRVFRDETGLSVNPHLWGSIERALDDSRYFVLLLSPAAAESPWVAREVQHWLATKSPETLLPVLTEGTFLWDSARGEFDVAASTALPAALIGIYAEEPRFLDLRWARDETQLDLRHSQFRSQIAALAAPIHGIAKEDLEGEDVRLHRRALRLAWASGIALVLLTLAAVATSIFAVNAAAAAHRSAARARNAQQRADTEATIATAERADAEHQKQVADQNAMQAQSSAQEAQSEKDRADASAVVADDQRRLADLNAQQAQANAQQSQQNAAQAQANLALADAAQAEIAKQNAQLQDVNGQLSTANRQLQSTNTQLRQSNDALAAQRDETARQRDQAESHSLAASAADAFDAGRFDLGLLLADEASRINPDAQARSSLLDGLRLQPTLVGHLQGFTSEVEAVAVSPDRRLVAATDLGGTVDVWDVRTRARIAQRVPAQVCDAGGIVAFDPNSDLIASATRCGSDIDVWAPRTGVMLRSLPIKNAVDSLAFDASGTRLAAGSVVAPATIWDVSTGKVVRALLLSPAVCQQVAFSPDGNVVACGGEENESFGGLTDAITVQFWNAHNGHALAPPAAAYPGFDNTIFSLTFSPDSKTLTSVAAGSGVHPMIRWDVSTGDPIGAPFGPLMAPGDTVVGVSPSLGRIVSFNTADQSLSLRDVDSGISDAAPLRVPLGGAFEASDAVAFSADGRTLVAGGADGPARIWQLDASARLATSLPIAVSTNDVVTLSPDGRTVRVVHGGVSTLRDVASGQPVSPQPPIAASTSPTFSGDGHTLVWKDAANRIRAWDIAPGRFVGPPVPMAPDCFILLAVNFDGRRAAIACGFRGDVKVVDLDSGRVHDVPSTDAFELTAAFSRDDRLLAIGASTVQIWDVSSRSLVAVQPEGQDQGSFPSSLAFSPDGRTLAAGGALGSAAVFWDVATGQLRQTPPSGFNATDVSDSMVVFSADGSTVATGTMDGAVRLWNVASAQLIGTPFTRLPVVNGQVQGKSARVIGLAFTPDSQSLVSATEGSADAGTQGPNEIVRWDLRLPVWQADACAIANRNLTIAEWDQYVGPAIAYRRTCDDLP